MPERLKHLLAQLLQPLMLASYLAWGAVWLASVARFDARDPYLGMWARALLLVFLVCWVSREVFCSSNRRVLPLLLCAVPATASTLGVILLGSSAASPVLLILLACLLAGMMSARALVPLLVIINLLVVLIIVQVWGWSVQDALIQMMAYVAFQAFAVLVLRYAERAEAMSEQLREVNAELLATRSLLVEAARDSERLHLSRELHDLSGHKLTALKLNLRALAAQPGMAEQPQLEQACALADELLQDIRAVVRQLREHDGLDLAQALQRLVPMFPRPRLHLDIDANARVPDADRAETLLRIAQEGLGNAARHGSARHAWLSLKRDGDTLVLGLEDDGRVGWPLTPGVGLTSMRERLQPLGGELSLQPSPRGGLSLRATLPLERAS